MRNNYMRSCALALIVVSGLWAGGGLWAQAAPSGATPAAATPGAAAGISLAQARAAVLARSRDLRKAGIAVESALLVEKGQAYASLPGITATTGAKLGLSATPSVTGSAGITVSQSIWDGGSGRILAAIDALSTKAARAEARAAYFSALESADLAWYGVLAQEEAVTAATSDLEAANASLALAQAKMGAGIITKAELLKAQAESAAAETALGQARLSLRAGRAKLSSLTALSLPAELPGIDFGTYEGLMKRLAGLDEAGLESLVKSLWAAAAANNPSLATASLAQDAARLQIDKAKAGYLPSITAAFSSGLSLAESGTSYSGSLSVTASVPLDLWSTALAVKEKALAADSSALDLEEGRRSLELELTQAAYTWASASRSIFSSRQALDYAESNYATVLESYRLSLVSASTLSDAASLVSTDRKAWNAARYTFLESLAALRTLTGLEDEGLLAGMLP